MEPHDPENALPEEVVLPIEDEIDLHAFSPKDVRSVVESYVEAAVLAGFREVRIVHGRGKGVQRASVRALLERLPGVESLRDAPPGSGGWGATIAVLRLPRHDAG